MKENFSSLIWHSTPADKVDDADRERSVKQHQMRLTLNLVAMVMTSGHRMF